MNNFIVESTNTSRVLRSSVNKENHGDRESTPMMKSKGARASSSSVIKKSFRQTVNPIITTRKNDSNAHANNKENYARKEALAPFNSVMELKKRYEESLILHKSNTIEPDVKRGATIGVIRTVKKLHIEPGDEKNIAAIKRLGIRDDDVFMKPRFEVYKDERAGSSVGTRRKDKKSEEKSEARKLSNESCNVQNERTDRMIQSESSTGQIRRRVTAIEPIEALSPRPKKIKVLHRKSLMNKFTETCRSAGGSFSYDLRYGMPYADKLIECELEKEKIVSRNSRKMFRQRNITDSQRKIIVKFLIRLHCHLFYPSYFLYQTVKLFDAVLDATPIDLEELQLTALATMWIALKREQNIYKIPTAKTMISFSKDLYQGKTDLLLKCEVKILEALQFNIVYPDSFSILLYDIITCDRARYLSSKEIETAYYCGSYMIDVALLDQYLIETSAVLLAAAAAETSLYLTIEEIKDTSSAVPWSAWRAAHTSQRYSERDIEPVRTLLIRKVFESCQKHADGAIVFKKYNRSIYGRVSQFFGAQVQAYFRIFYPNF